MTELRSDHIDRAVEDGVLSQEQADALWARARIGQEEPRRDERPARPLRLDPLRAAAGAGIGLVAAGCAAWLLLLGWERLGGAGEFAIAAAYAVALAAAAARLDRRSLEGPAGLLAGVAVALVPIAVHGFQRWLGLVPTPADVPGTLAAFVRSAAFFPTLAGISAAIVALRALASPILAAVLVCVLWFAVMLAAPAVLGPFPSWNQRAFLSGLYGVVVLATGIGLDGRTRRDVSGWLYLSGLVAFWGGLTTYDADTGPALLLGAAVNAWLVAVSLALHRRSFAVFGAIGLAGVLAHLAEQELANEALPFAFAAIAIAVVAAGLAYRRLEPAWQRAIVARTPESIRRMLPRRVRGP